MLLGTMPQVVAGSGGIDPFDPRQQGYDFDEAVAYLSALTDPARAAYLGPQRIADTLYPVGFTGAVMLGTYLALRVWTRVGAAVAGLVALIYLVFDMRENAAVAGLLRTDLELVTPEQVAHASSMTVLKFQFVNAALIILAVAIVARLARFLILRKRRQK